MEFKGRAPISSNLSLTPLIDVVFLLLIFFMLTSTMVVEEAIELNLPSADTGSASETEALTISVNSDTNFYIDGDLLDLQGLQSRILDELENDNNKPVVVRSDSEVSIQTFVSVMDAVRKAGGTNVSLATLSN